MDNSDTKPEECSTPRAEPTDSINGMRLRSTQNKSNEQKRTTAACSADPFTNSNVPKKKTDSSDEEAESDDELLAAGSYSFRDRLIHDAHVVQHKMEDMAHRVVEEVEEVAHKVKEEVEEVAHKIYEAGWRVVHHSHLPEWMKDNEFLHYGHRPELKSFIECFKSVFRIHTETGNIWTHLLGMMAFVGITGYFWSRPMEEINWQEKAIFSSFFVGAIVCLAFSWIFHTVCCHSCKVGKLFNKLDYCGITILTVGSFIPWLYYCFYCRLVPKICYLVLIFVLGTLCGCVSLMDKFQTPKYRPVRAGMFVALGLSGVIPVIHLLITDGFQETFNKSSVNWLVLMAVLYISGAVIYAIRIPERIWPGKFDIWFHSHQIFHVFVVAAALVHYHGITQVANYRLTDGGCLDVISVM